jgi:hypothetical protein
MILTDHQANFNLLAIISEIIEEFVKIIPS